MNLRHIEAFKAVIENGTVQRAAEVMHISQPAVTKLLQAFERSAGFRVFDRVQGRLIATAGALTLYREVERVYAGVSDIRRAAGEIRTLQRGALAIGAMPALSAGFAQRVVRAFLQERLDVSIHLRSSQRVRLVDWVASGTLDAALINGAHEHPEVETELLLRTNAVCLLPPGHPLTRRKTIRASDLRNEPFISWSESTLTRAKVDAAFTQSGVLRAPRFTASTAPAICAFVAHGLGVALVHPLYVGVAQGAVVMRPFTPALELDVLLAYARRATQPPLVRAFADEARRQAKEVMRDMAP
jgi:DNA-binding transcriptional LysR family regulator